ncbi:hypothetical protein J3R83DRAFT_6903 [Lanmaoa asiatica]|nr:hypothetical protein J3R83DRAFT_6903 [Lanmaoa asiatica]
MIVQLYNSFLSTHLSSWLCTICTTPSLISPSRTKQLQDNIYAAGTDTLFSLDALKQPLDTLFDALSSSMSLISSLQLILPKLFTSFLSATRKHRSALFVSASSAVGGKDEIRKRGMEFVGRCWTLFRGSESLQEDSGVEKWKSIIGVFEIVEKERLFVACSIHSTHVDATTGAYGRELALSEARDEAVEMLKTVDASSKADYQAELVVLSTQLLDVLVQIEYDFVGSVLEIVLSALVNIPPPLFHLVIAPTSEFLGHVLEYHTKTRTVHTYVLALLGAVAANSAASTSWTSSSQSMTCTFPLAYHLPALARALRTSLIPTQTAPLATAVLQAVESAWRAFKDVYQEEERAVKKMKVTEDTDKSLRGARLVLARAFSYTGRVAGTILSNLPANAYTKDGEYSLEPLWGDVGKLGWSVIWDCLREKTGNGGEHDTAKGSDNKKRKHTVETKPPSARYSHIVTSAALRFLYDVRARASFLLGDCDRLGEAHVGVLLNVARDGASDPEMVLETVRGLPVVTFGFPYSYINYPLLYQIRTLLWHIWYTRNCEFQQQLETQSIFTVTIDILTTRLSSESKWSGVSADLTRDNLGLAVLYVLTDRWIDVLDALASTEDMERLVSLLLAVSLDLPEEDTRDDSDEIVSRRDHVVITLQGILLNLFRNAQFWELHNIRAVFLSSILTLTAPLSSYCFPVAGVDSPSPITTATRTELTLVCNVYRLLHYVPPEYLTRPVRAELVKRAMAGDFQVCIALQGANEQGNEAKRKGIDKSHAGLRGKSHMEETDDRVPADELENWSRRLTFTRVFLQRMGQPLNTPSYTVSFIFLVCTVLMQRLYKDFTLTSVTLDLIQLHIVSLLRSQEPEAVASISSVISTLIAARPFSQLNSQETWTHIIVQSSVLRLIERLTGDFDPASLPDRVKCALKTLLEALESALLPHAQRLVERDTTELDQFLSSEQINAWSRTLSLTQWLGMDSQVASVPFGLKLATSTIRSENSAGLDPETCSSVLGLLFEELWCMPDAFHRVHLDVLVGFYVVNGGDRVEHTMDAHVTQASKKLSVEDFSHLLDVLADGIGGSGLRVGQRERLIRLGKVMLHDAPQGTLKVIQNFATRCFNLFADREELYGGPSHLKMQYLEFIARHCSDRPAAIRSMDLGSIWSLLNKILSGSSGHDATTAFPIFHHIVTIIGALIRLRRDLVPCPSPADDAQPGRYVPSSAQNRAKSSQTRSRRGYLLPSLYPRTKRARSLVSSPRSPPKTIPRTHAYAHPSTTSTESHKAESLAKPFAKHASYVLVAYVDAFNDSLCIINAETRRDLEPGLFALCEMVGEHSRDALMVSALDSGGKTILKSLWKEYEKQRYVGKG